MCCDKCECIFLTLSFSHPPRHWLYPLSSPLPQIVFYSTCMLVHQLGSHSMGLAEGGKRVRKVPATHTHTHFIFRNSKWFSLWSVNPLNRIYRILRSNCRLLCHTAVTAKETHETEEQQQKKETKCNNVRKFRRCRQMSKALIHTHTTSTRHHDAKRSWEKKSPTKTFSGDKNTHTRVRIPRTQKAARRIEGEHKWKKISADERGGIVCVAPSLGNDNKIAANVNEQWSFCSTKN